MTKKLARLEAEIRRLVPRLTEPTKGSFYAFKNEYLVNPWLLFEAGERIELVKMDVKYGCYFLHPKIRNVLEFPRSFVKSSLEILGHPIDLEAVLQSINRRWRGTMLASHIEQKYLDVLHLWICGKPLSAQSDELKRFLFDILCTDDQN